MKFAICWAVENIMWICAIEAEGYGCHIVKLCLAFYPREMNFVFSFPVLCYESKSFQEFM
jgi:hypothetical protein